MSDGPCLKTWGLRPPEKKLLTECKRWAMPLIEFFGGVNNGSTENQDI